MTDIAPTPPPGSTQQPVLTPLTGAAIFLVLTLDAGGEATTRELLADLSGLQRSVSFRALDGGLAVVASIGSAAWDRLFGDEPRPAQLHPFRELTGARHHAPSTPGDLLFHIRAVRMDLCFELATQLVGRLAGAASVVDEVSSFRYFDERDLLGFVDGTENPTGLVAATAVTIGEEDSTFTGGSYVIVQKYLHDMPAWNALTVEQQEQAVGRTKLTNIELAEKAADSHVALNVITGPDGAELKIVRDNMPFGRVGAEEYGTYFIGYASTPAVIEQMLTNMFIGDPPGTTDRLLEFSRAITGTLFFVPTADFLDSLGD